MVFKNVWFPFHYVADIVKDSIQLALCIMVVDGFENAFKNWLSFSSVVSYEIKTYPSFSFIFGTNWMHTTIYSSTHQVIWCTLLSIVIPILFAGTMKIGKASARHILFDILTAIVQPIILHHQLTVAKVVRMKFLRQKDLALSPNYHEVCNIIKSKQEELSKQNRLQLSIETIFQLTGNVILLFYAYSFTRTSQGLAALFMEDKIIFMGTSLSSKFVLGLLMAMNLASFINVHINGIVQGYSSNNKIAGKLMLLLSILCGSLVRILSITFYFSPTLGLLNLLHHYQGTNLIILISTYILCYG